MKYFNIILFICVGFGCTSFFSQSENNITIKGEVADTLNKKGVENAVVMAVRVRDSVLVTYSRTLWNGTFEIQIPRDTFQIFITHPKFEDREYFIFGNENTKDLDFGRLIMPPKGEELKEFVVFSNNEPIFFRGDTLVMVADSFKTGANANVEDLFKKLPGFDVDKSGKIVVHGKEVNKVYVDGDEFFGTDPTIATKNLPANAIENVEVYEQKIEGDNTDETEKVINLTLKESAKKGYFGKVNGASDFQNFYEGEVLANRFKGDQKISIFGLFTNTPRSDFNWQDRYQFGLTEEMGNRNDDGNYIFEPQIGNLGEGLPQKAKTGFYYTDKIGKSLKIGTNFTYDNQEVVASTISNTEFLLADTTYSSFSDETKNSQQEAFAFNLNLEFQIDSLTTLEIAPRVKQIYTQTQELASTSFYSADDFETRNTSNQYDENIEYVEASIASKFERKFKKENRNLKINYNLRSQTNSSVDVLDNSDFDVMNSINLFSTLQNKNGKSTSLQHYGELTYVEPISKKLKLELKYMAQYSEGTNQKFAFDISDEGNRTFNSFFSSDFENTTLTQRVGGRFIYNVKKHEMIAGADWNNLRLNSFDVLNENEILQDRTNFLPFVRYKYKFSRSKTLTFTYRTKIQNPSISQLQPLPDNRNINNIRVGNIDLVNQLENAIAANFFTYKATTGSHTYANASFSFFENAFSQAIIYDNQGRAVNQTINVKGNQNFNSYFGTSIPFFKQKIKFEPFVNLNYFDIKALINGMDNTTQTVSTLARGNVSYIMDSLTIKVGVDYNYAVSETTLSPDLQKSTQISYNAGFELKLKHSIIISSDIDYIINSQRAAGFDLTYILWDASIGKTFLKKENLIISVDANDILNQNISNTRNVFNNIVVDKRTNIIGRYILLRAVYKFNVLKSNKNEDEKY